MTLIVIIQTDNIAYIYIHTLTSIKLKKVKRKKVGCEVAVQVLVETATKVPLSRGDIVQHNAKRDH